MFQKERRARVKERKNSAFFSLNEAANASSLLSNFFALLFHNVVAAPPGPLLPLLNAHTSLCGSAASNAFRKESLLEALATGRRSIFEREKAEQDEREHLFDLLFFFFPSNTPLSVSLFSFLFPKNKKPPPPRSRAQPDLHLRQEGRLRGQRRPLRRLRLDPDGRFQQQPLSHFFPRRNRRGQSGSRNWSLDAAARNASAGGDAPEKGLRPPRAQGRPAAQPSAGRFACREGLGRR